MTNNYDKTSMSRAEVGRPDITRKRVGCILGAHI